MIDYNEAIRRIIEGRKNPIQWIENNIKIIHPSRGIINFELYPFQKNAINLMLAKHFVITLKSRQVGFSTISQATALWAALHYANYKVLILSTGIRSAVKFLGDIRGMYDRMNPEDKWWSIKNDDLAFLSAKKGHVANNKTEIEFENGSSILALPASSSAARGVSANLLIIDEAAFIDNIEAAYAGIFPTLSRAFKGENRFFGIITISTPNGISGQGEWYYKQYMNAVNKKSRFIPLRVHWSEVDEYDEAWYLEQCETLGWDTRAIASELELSFLSSGNTYIPAKLLNLMKTIQPIHRNLDESLWIFEDPIPGRQYVMGVDFAYGTGRDASAIQVIDALTLKQVAEYLSPTVLASQFADIIYNLHKRYNNTFTNIERNAGGKILIERILEFHPEMEKRMFRDTKTGDLLSKQPKFGELLKNSDPDIGTVLTGTSRDIVLSNMYNILLEKYLELTPDFNFAEDDAETAKLRFLNSKNEDKKEVNVKINGIISSERLLLQLLGFVIDKLGKPQGDKDDAVLAYAHALYAWAKSRHFLLKDIANMLPEKVEKNPKLEFEKKYNTQLLRSLNSRHTEKEIDEFMKELDEEDMIRRQDFDDKQSEIYSAFFF